MSWVEHGRAAFTVRRLARGATWVQAGITWDDFTNHHVREDVAWHQRFHRADNEATSAISPADVSEMVM